MKAEMSATEVGDMIHWRSVKLVAFDVRLLDDLSEDFQRYAKEMTDLYECRWANDAGS